MFDHGHRLHRHIAALLDSEPAVSGWTVSTIEESVSPALRESGLGIERGRLDLELEHRSGRRVVVDIKTMRSGAFKWLKGTKRPHALQVQAYAMMRGAVGGAVLYVDREGTRAMRQYPVRRDDATVQRAARVLTKIQAREGSPPPLRKGPKGKAPWVCEYGQYLGTSCEEAQ